MGRNSIDRTGERHINKEGCEVEIIKWINSNNCTIMFDDGMIYYNVKYINIKRGTIKNLYTPKVFKKGFLGIGKYKATTNGKINKNEYYYSDKITILHNIVLQKKESVLQ